MISIPKNLVHDYPEVTADEFYREIFPPGELDTWKSFTPHKYTGIIIKLNPRTGKFTRRYILTDEFHSLHAAIDGTDFCIMAPASYAGWNRKAIFARFLYAIAIDLDYVDTKANYRTLINQIEFGSEMGYFGLPRPTFLVASGTGIHIYYVFKEPIPCFGNIMEQLETLKGRLTWQAWTQGASSYERRGKKIQYEPLLQAHRMVGSITKVGTRVRAFRTGMPITVAELNEYVPEDYRVKDFTYKSNLLLSDAAALYPEWYEKRIVRGEPRGTWTCHKDLYEWWIQRTKEEAQEGHRYWCIFSLVAYAQKCDVSEDQVREDAYALVPYLTRLGDSPFTREDVDAALKAYDPGYKNYPIKEIEKQTGIHIKRNKRNGRTRKQHVKLMTLARDLDDPEGTWRKKGSREHVVTEWRKAHPYGSRSECVQDTGLSRQTVAKWWGFSGGTSADVVRAWREDHPEGYKAQCARATGLSRQTVYKYWEE